MLAKLLTEDVPVLQLEGEQGGVFLAGCLRRALSRDPNRRPQSMQGLARELLSAALADGIAVPAEPDPVALPHWSDWRSVASERAVPATTSMVPQPPNPSASPPASAGTWPPPATAELRADCDRAAAKAKASLTRLTSGQVADAVAISSDATWQSLEAQVARVPADAMIRGLFMRDALRSLASPPSRRYLPFGRYPLTEYLPLLLQAARESHPDDSPANALMKIGLTVFPVFASSLAGSAIFSVAGDDFISAVRLAPRAYSVTLDPGSIAVDELGPEEVLLRLRDVWVFPEVFHAGVWLGAMDYYQVHGTIDIERHSPCEVDFHLRWGTKHGG